MEKEISNDLVGKWLKGWSLSRNLPLPTAYRSGFIVEVNDEREKSRYVFSELNADFLHLAKTTSEPRVFLKVCTTFDRFKNAVPDHWKVQPQGYMMRCFQPMKIPDRSLHEDYRLEYEHYNSTSVVKIVTENGEFASIGRVVIVDDLAIYDRIFTESNHQRKGLATKVMMELEQIALSKGVFKNFLVATEEGRPFYQTLGWELYSLYTSIVIPS